MEEKETITAPYYQDLVDDFMQLYEPCTMHDRGVIDYTIPMLREFFNAYPQFGCPVDPLPQYLDALASQGFPQRHNHEGTTCLFVRDRYAEYEEVEE